VDPLNPDYERFPNYRLCNPLQVTVEAGEMLYLPSLWYHHVQQQNDAEGKVLAVNYWYDMNFTHHYLYYEFCRNISSMLQKETT